MAEPIQAEDFKSPLTDVDGMRDAMQATIDRDTMRKIFAARGRSKSTFLADGLADGISGTSANAVDLAGEGGSRSPIEPPAPPAPAKLEKGQYIDLMILRPSLRKKFGIFGPKTVFPSNVKTKAGA